MTDPEEEILEKITITREDLVAKCAVTFRTLPLLLQFVINVEAI